MAKIRPIPEGYEAAIPYGDRAGKLEDPFGHTWWLSTRTEEVSVDEMKSRAAKLFGGA